MFIQLSLSSKMINVGTGTFTTDVRQNGEGVILKFRTGEGWFVEIWTSEKYTEKIKIPNFLRAHLLKLELL